MAMRLSTLFLRTLREDGILDQINQEWLAQQGAPELS